MTDRRRGARPRTPDRIGTADCDGEVQVRFSGEIADITALLDTLAAAGVELTGTSRPYANQRGTGVRVYTPSPRRNTPGPDRSGTHSAAHRSGRRAGPRGRRVNVAAGRSDSSSHPIRYRQKEMSQ